MITIDIDYECFKILAESTLDLMKHAGRFDDNMKNMVMSQASCVITQKMMDQHYSQDDYAMILGTVKSMIDTMFLDDNAEDVQEHNNKVVPYDLNAPMDTWLIIEDLFAKDERFQAYNLYLSIAPDMEHDTMRTVRRVFMRTHIKRVEGRL